MKSWVPVGSLRVYATSVSDATETLGLLFFFKFVSDDKANFIVKQQSNTKHCKIFWFYM